MTGKRALKDTSKPNILILGDNSRRPFDEKDPAGVSLLIQRLFAEGGTNRSPVPENGAVGLLNELTPQDNLLTARQFKLWTKVSSTATDQEQAPSPDVVMFVFKEKDLQKAGFAEQRQGVVIQFQDKYPNARIMLVKHCFDCDAVSSATDLTVRLEALGARDNCIERQVNSDNWDEIRDLFLAAWHAAQPQQETKKVDGRTFYAPVDTVLRNMVLGLTSWVMSLTAGNVGMVSQGGSSRAAILPNGSPEAGQRAIPFVQEKEPKKDTVTSGASREALIAKLNQYIENRSGEQGKKRLFAYAAALRFLPKPLANFVRGTFILNRQANVELAQTLKNKLERGNEANTQGSTSSSVSNVFKGIRGKRWNTNVFSNPANFFKNHGINSQELNDIIREGKACSQTC